MASYSVRGLPNEYTSNLHINTYPDSDESDFSDSDAEHADLMYSRHTVALDSNFEESDVQRGLYNRHNFLVNNYNNVQAQNFMQLRISSKRMPRLLPMGGIRSRHMTSRFERRNFQNLIVIFMGWMTGLFPPTVLIVVGCCTDFTVQFVLLYLLASLFLAHIVAILILRSNAKLFCSCPFMIPVTTTSHHLHGLQNNFKDIPIDEFTGMKIVKYKDRKAIQNTVTYLGIIDEDEFTVRVMFYSPDYFYKYLTVPQNRIYKLIALSFVCLAVSITIYVKELTN